MTDFRRDWDWHTDFSRPPMLVGEVYTECIAGARKMRTAAYDRLVRLQMAAYYAADRLALAEGRRRMDEDH